MTRSLPLAARVGISLAGLAAVMARAGAAGLVDVAVALEDARRAYAAQVTADRVRVEVRTTGLATWKDELVIRLAPGGEGGANQSGAHLSLELDQLRVYASAGTLVGTHVADDTSCFVATYAPPLTPGVLGRILPPLPLPELALAADPPDPPGRALTPYTRNIAWDSASVDEKTDPNTVVMTGRCDPAAPGGPPGKVTLSTDLRTGRLRRFVAMLEPGRELILDIRPVEPGDPAGWAIDPGPRTRVPALADLRPRPGDVTVGRPVPDFSLQTLDRHPVELGSLFPPPSPGAVAAAVAQDLVLLFIRDPASTAPLPGAPNPDALAAAAAIHSLHERTDRARLTPSDAQPGQAPPAFVDRVVFVLDLAASDVMARLDALAKQWSAAVAGGGGGTGPGGGGGGAGAASAAPLWATSAKATIDRFLPGAKAAIVVIRADRTLAAVIPVDSRASHQDPLQAELEAALRGAARPPAPPP